MDFILIFLVIFLYFLPSVIGGKKRNINAIFVLNLFLGWTAIGWIVAMVWACTKDPEQPKIIIQESEPKKDKEKAWTKEELKAMLSKMEDEDKR